MISVSVWMTGARPWPMVAAWKGWRDFEKAPRPAVQSPAGAVDRADARSAGPVFVTVLTKES